jgi:hypothetical protein
VDSAEQPPRAPASSARRPRCDPWNKAARHSNACRRGRGRACAFDWCSCACHARPAAEVDVAASPSPAVVPARQDGANRDPRLVAALRQHAAALQISLLCSCGRAEVDADGICPACERDLPWRLQLARQEQDRAELARRHELAIRVECPYCGVPAGAVCVTSPARYSYGVRDHKGRYRAACHLFQVAETGATVTAEGTPTA